MKFNGITTGGGGSAATELTDWATRLDGTHSEGDLAVWTATGAYYKWCSALRGGSGDWVRSEAYTSSIGDLAYVDGTEIDQSQALTQGWDSIIENGTGTVTFDGTHAKIYSNVAGTSNYAYFNLQASCPVNVSGTFYTSGLYTVNAILNTSLRFEYQAGIRSTTGAGTYHSSQLFSNNGVPNINAINAANPVYGTNTEGEFSVAAGEIHVAFHGTGYKSSNDIGLHRVWINHSLVPYMAGQRFYSAASGGAQMFIYVRATDMKLRAFSSGYIP